MQKCCGEEALNERFLKSALLVVDVQVGFDEPIWGPRNNPHAEENIAALLAAWRSSGGRILHVHHESQSPSGQFQRNTAGQLPKPEAQPAEGEKIYRKSVNSAFIGTCLEADLREACIDSLVVVGLTTNHCVSTTVRMASNLGFDVFVVTDATAAFDRAALDGTTRLANDVHTAALSDLQGEFAQLVDTGAIIAQFGTPRR